MKFIKTTLYLIMIFSIAQASTKNNQLNRPNKKSYVKRALTMVVITFIGVEAYKSYQLDASLKNLSTELDNCVNTCNQPDTSCYNECIEHMFGPAKTTYCSDATQGSRWFDKCHKRNRRNSLRWDFESCRKSQHKGCDQNNRFTSKECALAVIEHAKNAQPHNQTGVYPAFFHPDMKWLKDCPQEPIDPVTGVINNVVAHTIVKPVCSFLNVILALG